MPASKEFHFKMRHLVSELILQDFEVKPFSFSHPRYMKLFSVNSAEALIQLHIAQLQPS